jgi:nitroreductase
MSPVARDDDPTGETTLDSDPPAPVSGLLEVVRRRRSVRKFEPGRRIPRATLLQIVEAGRWAPSGANAQPWDFVCVDDPQTRERVREVLQRQQARQREDTKGTFPSVNKRYLQHTVAIVLVLGDRRWDAAFPHAMGAEHADEYLENDANIFFCSIGAAVQNIQLAATAFGLASAWLSSGGEPGCAGELRSLLRFPESHLPYAIVPIGYPAADERLRYRRPLEQLVHWNGYDQSKYRPQELIDYYVTNLRAFATYRGSERMEEWPDYEERVGPWKGAFE